MIVTCPASKYPGRVALVPLVSLAFLAACGGSDPSDVSVDGDARFEYVISSASGTCAPAVGTKYSYPVHVQISTVLDYSHPAGQFYLLNIEGLPGPSSVQHRFSYQPYKGSSFFLSASYMEGNAPVQLLGSLTFTSSTQMAGTASWSRFGGFSAACASGESRLTIR